jgi:Rhodopirellula transposase DDE domain
VAARLHEAGSRLQANRKTREGLAHPDRNAPFEDRNASGARSLIRDQPALSVDPTTKEWVGDFQNGGREWRPHGEPEAVRVHDFLDQTLGKAIPSGVDDMINNQGWVSVGIDPDPAQCATNSIRRWWHEMGQDRFPKAGELLITADGGGSHGHRTRLWKVSLQALADELGRTLQVGHFPPGTSQWNPIEHRLFRFITQNWRGRPLVSHQAIVSLIAGTTTSTGLMVKAAWDTNHDDTEIKVSEQELAQLRLQRHEFHGDWNSTISPRRRKL